jgi:hypothetical protein
MGKFGFSNISNEVETAQKAPVRYEFFKVTDEPKQIRFLTLDGENSIAMWMEHFTEFKNTWKRSTSCPDYEAEKGSEKKCLICQSRKGRDEDIVRDNCNVKIAMQVIERLDGEEGDKLKVFKFTPFLWNTIKQYFEEYGDLGDRDYTLSMNKNIDGTGKTSIVYEMTPATRKPTPLTAADKELASKRAKLEDVEPKYNEQEIRNIMSKDKAGGTSIPQKSEVANMFSQFLSEASNVEETPKVVNSKETAEDDDDEEEFFKSLKMIK